MKRIYLSLLGIGLLASAQAQTPEKKSMALVHKLTGVKCFYCGEWGWTMANELITATEGKALYMNVYVPFGGSSFFSNPTSLTFYGNTSGQFASPGWGGIPDFGVNGVGLTTNTATNATFTDPVNTFAATTPLASPANKMTISGNTVTATAKVQFWAAGSGEYYLAAYLIEDGAMSDQSGPAGSNGAVAHHKVLRGSMSTDKPFGEQIINGAVTANQTFNKTFTFNITDATWNKTKMTVYTVIWKKNGTKYDYVNGSKSTGGATSVEELINTSSLNIFPNPVSNTLSLKMDVVKSCAATLTVTDVAGRLVNTTAANLKQGTNTQTVNTASLTPGLYFLNIQTDNGTIQKKFVKE